MFFEGLLDEFSDVSWDVGVGAGDEGAVTSIVECSVSISVKAANMLASFTGLLILLEETFTLEGVSVVVLLSFGDSFSGACMSLFSSL